LVVDKRRNLDDGVALVSMGQLFCSEGFRAAATPSAFEETACDPETKDIGEEFILKATS
jgi:hypothetical protein